MGTFGSLFKKLGNMNLQGALSRDESIPDDETTDKTLRALRRQRRVQLEAVEKERLKKQILASQRLQEKKMFNDGVNQLRKDKNIRPKKHTFYGRSNLLRGGGNGGF